MKEICDFCIMTLERCAKEIGTSYAALNVWLFIIIQPLLIIFGCISTIKCANTKSWNVKNNLKCASYLILIFGVILVIYIFLVDFSFLVLSDQ